DVDAVGHREHARREVQDACDAGRDQPVGHRLRGVYRRRDHRDGDVLAGHDHGQVVDVVHHEAVDALADPGRVGVEERGDAEPAVAEARVPGQRVTEVTHADQCDAATMGQAEDVL